MAKQVVLSRARLVSHGSTRRAMIPHEGSLGSRPSVVVATVVPAMQANGDMEIYRNRNQVKQRNDAGAKTAMMMVLVELIVGSLPEAIQEIGNVAFIRVWQVGNGNEVALQRQGVDTLEELDHLAELENVALGRRLVLTLAVFGRVQV